jgi:hypothetical protein
MCLRSCGLVNEGSDDEGGDSDNEDIRKDRVLSRAELNEVVMSSQL